MGTAEREDIRRLLKLLLQHQRRNQRLVYVLLAVAVASMTAVLLHLIWYPEADSPGVLVAFGAVSLAAIAAFWGISKVGKENHELRAEAAKLARKLKLIP